MSRMLCSFFPPRLHQWGHWGQPKREWLYENNMNQRRECMTCGLIDERRCATTTPEEYKAEKVEETP